MYLQFPSKFPIVFHDHPNNQENMFGSQLLSLLHLKHQQGKKDSIDKLQMSEV